MHAQLEDDVGAIYSRNAQQAASARAIMLLDGTSALHDGDDSVSNHPLTSLQLKVI